MIVQGIHVYINIENFNDIILDEESQTNKVTKSIHALDTFFSEIERYGNNHFSKSFVIEKITGSRLHFYVVDDIQTGFKTVKSVVSFAFKLSQCINTDIGKYKNLKDFKIQIGCDYGRFFDFEFETEEGYVEMTSIGYVANFAAKLQGLTTASTISISKELYSLLENSDKANFVPKTHPSLYKYQQNVYYNASLSRICESFSESLSDDIKLAKDFANKVNLSDIDYSEVRKTIDYRTLSKTRCKHLMGIPMYADIRGFTSQFDKNDTNLEEMSAKTQLVLKTMYDISTKHGGVHVQFQGDRELSLFHNIPGDYVEGILQPDKYCFKNAILCAMRMIDEVKHIKLCIGVGADFGKMFATKIGVRGSKDNILLGETVINADFMEDNNANENQIAVTEAVYNGLLNEDSYLAKKFVRVENYYITTISYGEYIKDLSYLELERNTKSNNYNGAWLTLP